jgi:hypothetical protein
VKIKAEFLLALEEDGMYVLACPGGGLGGRVLLALEEGLGTGLACPVAKGSVRPCLPGRRDGTVKTGFLPAL